MSIKVVTANWPKVEQKSSKYTADPELSRRDPNLWEQMLNDVQEHMAIPKEAVRIIREDPEWKGTVNIIWTWYETTFE